MELSREFRDHWTIFVVIGSTLTPYSGSHYIPLHHCFKLVLAIQRVLLVWNTSACTCLRWIDLSECRDQREVLQMTAPAKQ